jgi:hypothetical protein
LFTQEINVKEETFGIGSSSTSRKDHEARHKSRQAMNMTPNDPRTEASTCKSSGTQPENNKAFITRIQALTVKETTSKAHMQVHTNKESCKKQPGSKPGPNQDEMGPVRRHFCPRCFSIYCLRRRRPPHRTNHSTDAIHQKTAAARRERESWIRSSQGSTLAEGRKQEEDSKPLA